MNRSRWVSLSVFLTCCLMGRPTLAAVHLTLPDSGAYSYWVQSLSGAVAAAPINVTGHRQVTLPASIRSGTLFVLDQHDNDYASLPIQQKPLNLTVNDFKPLPGPAATVPTQTTPSASAVKAAASTPVAHSSSSGGIEGFITLVFGLLVAAGVAWVLWHLIQSRGKPLIEAARRIGVDVPDPTEATPEQPAPVYAPPVARAVQKIPEEAGVIPLAAIPRVYHPTPGTFNGPQIVGIQGVAAGSAFAVPMGETFLGRDGENGIVLADSTVSRRHARFTRDTGNQVSLSDAGSANGIHVNGNRVNEAQLSSGDQIQIGDNYFRFES